MILSFVILGIALAAVVQPSDDRRISAVIYAAPIVAYELFSGGLSDVQYYVGDALLATITAVIIGGFRKNSLQKPIVLLCLASIALNFMGWALYEAGFSPILYDSAFLVLYSVAIWRLISGGHGDVGDSMGDSESNLRRANVRRYAPKSLQHSDKIR